MTTYAVPSTASTATTTSVTPADRTAGRVSWKRGLATVVAAAAASTAVAAAFHATGHPLSLDDGAIPVAAFAQFVLFFGIVGIVIARHTSRATFFRVTAVLTALSCVPDIAFGSNVTSTLGLVTTHLVAAAIIIPRVARAH